MEHTGIYNYPLLDYLSVKQIAVWLESALHIKHSCGLQRGKNDKIDASVARLNVLLFMLLETRIM